MQKYVIGLIALLVVGVAAFYIVGAQQEGAQSNRPIAFELPPSTEVNQPDRASAPLPAVPGMRADNRLVIGRISTNVRKHWPRLEAMAEYLAAELAPAGVAGVDVRMVETVEEMRALLRSGEIDLLSETAFAAIELTNDNSAEMLLREWKSGVSDYHTIIFARRDGAVRSLGDLIGRTFVFEDRGSTSGYLIPRAHIVHSGFSMVELDNPLDRPPADTVGFAFADDEGTVIDRVRRGFADAGAISNLDWADEDEVSELERQELMIVHETAPVIRSIMLVRSTLDSTVKARLTQVLLRMHESEAGLETLRQYWKVARFDRIEGPALESLLNARAMHRVSSNF